MTKSIIFPGIFANIKSEAKFENGKVFRRQIKSDVAGEWVEIESNSFGLKEHKGHEGLWAHFVSQVNNPLYADRKTGIMPQYS